MPYESKAQAAYFHEHKAELERQGVNVDEWDAASKGKTLPERAMSKDKGTAGLTEKKESKKPAEKKKDKGGKELHMHIRPAHNGGHIVEHETRDEHGMPDGKRHEYALADTAALHDHIDEHYGDGSGADAASDEPDAEAGAEAGDVSEDDKEPEASAGE